MDEWDKIIRQKVSELDTPPPGTDWQPNRSWKTLREGLPPAADARSKQLRAWHYCAAALVILLVPFGVMLSDIQSQQAQIDRLSAQLKMTQAGGTKPVTRLPAHPVPGKILLPMPAQAVNRVSAGEKSMPRRVAKATPAVRPRLSAQPDALPVTEPAEPLLAQQPEPSGTQPSREANPQRTAPRENAAAQLLRVVNTSPRRKVSSVTFVFEGPGDSTSRNDLAAQTAPTSGEPKKRFIRIFQGSKPEEVSSDSHVASHNILSILTKKQ